jgi:hypothetical protein
MIIGHVSYFLGACVEGARVDQAVTPIGHEELGTQSAEVDADKGGDVELAGDIRDKFEKTISWFFEVVCPELIRPDPRPDLNVALNQCDGGGYLYCS